MKLYEVQSDKEKAILATVSLPSEERKGWSVDDASHELQELVYSSGKVKVVDKITARIDKPTPNFFIGKGKVEEIRQLIDVCEEEIDVVIFSENLSASQQRNLEEALETKVIDRTQLILDIFSQRAHSLDGKLQVELAQLEYLKPRLTGKGIMLSRLGGGLGTRGPGEKKLEIDRRRILKRIYKIRDDLKILKYKRQQRRETRKDRSAATVALVGYTNAGKSTLLNALTKANVYVDDKLFSTLDTTSRKLILPNNQKVIFIDTVGFLHNLPHNLIESFKATLEEVVQSDLLLHVVDVSNPKVNELMDSVYAVLKELNAQNKPIVAVLNKIDKLDNQYDLARLARTLNDAVTISALTGDGLSKLINIIMGKFSNLLVRIEALIPYRSMNLVNMIYNEGDVIKRRDTQEGIYIEAQVPASIKEKISSFLKIHPHTNYYRQVES